MRIFKVARHSILVLADGSVYEGHGFGADVDTYGEVVFNTSMTGYQEMLTDPSYVGQIVIPTYPLIGNYGVNSHDMESDHIQVRGFVVREEASEPNHYLSDKTLNRYLNENNIPGIAGPDTRAITRKLRSHGTMMGVLTSRQTVQQALDQLNSVPYYGNIDFVKEVSTRATFRWQPDGKPGRYSIVVLDCGCKYNILRLLRALNCDVTAVPCTASAKEILELKPDGLLISPGPGNPDILDYIVHNIQGLIGYIPIMGICLGNQLIARAFGGKNYKLKFGHRGGNHPVKDLRTGRVYITSQNHGYVPDPDSLLPELEISHVNLNDGTIEGLRHKTLPIFAIQYHSEASPGPLDSTYIFEEFLQMIDRQRAMKTS
jgi:carbamoyl-phosphate synthase small subunit